jgi:predicted RecB family nuclease
VCRSGEAEYESFWADDATGEAAMWSALLGRLAAFPDSPVYHYGSYEKKAFATLAKRHCKGSGLAGRLVNVASSVYGKVYFPVRSNGLNARPIPGGGLTDPGRLTAEPGLRRTGGR